QKFSTLRPVAYGRATQESLLGSSRRASLCGSHDGPRAFDDVLWGFKHFSHRLADFHSTERTHVELHAARLFEEFGIAHRHHEGRAQCCKPVAWHVGGRHEWPPILPGPDEQSQERTVSFRGREGERIRNAVREIGVVLDRGLQWNLQVAVLEAVP